jgi:cellulose synthase/poly-beta-1,6-N-acetylglucosamine synthase-like glycosyltransferase
LPGCRCVIDMARPFISVLIDTYNHERFIERAILSALQQDVAEGEREIIVVERTAKMVGALFQRTLIQAGADRPSIAARRTAE